MTEEQIVRLVSSLSTTLAEALADVPPQQRGGIIATATSAVICVTLETSSAEEAYALVCLVVEMMDASLRDAGHGSIDMTTAFIEAPHRAKH